MKSSADSRFSATSRRFQSSARLRRMRMRGNWPAGAASARVSAGARPTGCRKLSLRLVWRFMTSSFTQRGAMVAPRLLGGKPHAIDRRQVLADLGPALAAILGQPEMAGGRPHGQPLAALV